MTPSNWRVAGGELALEAGSPVLMGVVNASPESFSDGGASSSLDDQVARGEALLADGAAMLDVGGESGTTDRPPVPPEEEVRRVVPVVERLVALGAVVSVDTWKPEVARAALDAGAAVVNDVSGLADPALAEVCAAAGAGLVVMHTRAPPKHKAFPGYVDVVADVVSFLGERLRIAIDAGMAAGQLVVDPGPDFAKTPAETVEVLRHLPRLHELGRPVLLAVSRKDFIGAITGAPPRARVGGTLAAVGEGVDAGASILRVHDVRAVAEFLQVRAALRGALDVPVDLHLAEHLRRDRGGGA